MKNEDEKTKKCVLYDRDCIDCGDLNPLKICDNCGECIKMQDVATIKIDGIKNSED